MNQYLSWLNTSNSHSLNMSLINSSGIGQTVGTPFATSCFGNLLNKSNGRPHINRTSIDYSRIGQTHTEDLFREAIDSTLYENYTLEDFLQFREQKTGKREKQQTRMCSEVLFWCREQESRMGLLDSTPDNYTRTEILWTPTESFGSCADIDYMPKQLEQTTADKFRRNVQRGSHVVLHREKLSYDHHLLVLEDDKDAIKAVEYGFPESLINMIDVVLEGSLGQIHYKTITFDELFKPNAPRVYLVCDGNYPRTTEQMNAALERVTNRVGEKWYFPTCNNCEHFVKWVLTDTPASIQWRDACTYRRFIGDLLEMIGHVAVDVSVKLVVNKCLPEVLSKQFSVNRSLSEEKKCKRSINRQDVLLAIIYSLLHIMILYVKGGHSPEEYILEISKIVGFEVCLLLLGINRQLVQKLLLWKRNFISNEDLCRGLFKIGFVYLVCMIPGASIFFGSDSAIREIFGRCLFIVVCSALAGNFFDTYHPFIH